MPTERGRVKKGEYRQSKKSFQRAGIRRREEVCPTKDLKILFWNQRG